MEIVVGIPRALLFYKFEALWTTFFKELGAKLIISPPTNRAIKEKAIAIAPDEDCYSTKLYFGHVMALKDQVDYLFIPRFHSDHRVNVSCPKFLGLADVLRSMFPDLPPILGPYFSMAKSHDRYRHLFWRSFKMAWKITKNPFTIFKAMVRSLKAHKEENKSKHMSEDEFKAWELNGDLKQTKELNNTKDPKGTAKNNTRPLRIALAGHSYVLNDDLSNLDIREKIQAMGVEFITSEQLPTSITEKQMDKLDYNMFFQYEREILGTVMHFLDTQTVDGIIHLIIFSCGPDSIVGELANRFSYRKQSVPLLQLTYDELTGEAGLNTRLEAFFDMIKRRREN